MNVIVLCQSIYCYIAQKKKRKIPIETERGICQILMQKERRIWNSIALYYSICLFFVPFCSVEWIKKKDCCNLVEREKCESTCIHIYNAVDWKRFEPIIVLAKKLYTHTTVEYAKMKTDDNRVLFLCVLLFTQYKYCYRFDGIQWKSGFSHFSTHTNE